jgi:hypothetical protein
LGAIVAENNLRSLEEKALLVHAGTCNMSGSAVLPSCKEQENSAKVNRGR